MDYMPHIAYNSHSPLADPRLHQHRNNNGLSFESQEYDQKMAGIINATMEQGFKGDLNHVDHWFRLLSDTEQLAAVYTLLQHMSKDNARFFTKVLKQMSGDFESSSPAGYIQQQQQQAFASRRLSHPVAAFSTSTNVSNKLGNDVLGDHRLYHPLMSSDLFGGSSIVPPTSSSSATTTTTNNGRPRSVIEGSGYLLRGGGSTWGGDLGIQTSIAAAGSASMSSSSSGARSSVGSIGDRRPRPQSVDISAWTKRPDLTFAMGGGRDEKKNNAKSTHMQQQQHHSPLPSSWDKHHDASSTSSSSSSSQRGGSTTSVSNNSVTSSSNNNNKKPAEPSTIDLKELEDIPGWFRRLRLHKYTSLFEKLDWKEIIKMDDAQLEARGVAALGARRKMLKTFERVRAHCDAKDIDY